jgi:hypothetical protein
MIASTDNGYVETNGYPVGSQAAAWCNSVAIGARTGHRPGTPTGATAEREREPNEVLFRKREETRMAVSSSNESTPPVVDDVTIRPFRIDIPQEAAAFKSMR